MKKIPVIWIALYAGIEFLLFLAGFAADVFVKYEFIGERTIQLIIAFCMVVLPIPFLHIICKAVREKKLAKKDIVILALLLPLLGALLFGLYYAKHGVSFMFSSNNEYGLGAFIMGAISGFMVTVTGYVYIIIGLCAVWLLYWLRPLFKVIFRGIKKMLYHAQNKTNDNCNRAK